MKPISVENCLDIIPNKFELSLLAMNRAKRLMLGAKSNSEFLNIEKNSYIALKEIEDGHINIEELRENLKEDILRDNLFKKSSEIQEFNTITSIEEIENSTEDAIECDLDSRIDSESEFDEEFDEEFEEEDEDEFNYDLSSVPDDDEEE